MGEWDRLAQSLADGRVLLDLAIEANDEPTFVEAQAQGRAIAQAIEQLLVLRRPDKRHQGAPWAQQVRLVLARDGTVDIVSAGNFHGMPMAIPLDVLSIALSHVAGISERRVYHMLSAFDKEAQLPPYLSPDPGLHSGLMIAQYTAASLVSENKSLAHPASVDSIPSSANREDHVSMSTIAARKAAQIVVNVRNIVALELLTAEKGPITPERLLQIKFDTAYSRASFAGRWMDKILALDLKSEPDLAKAQALLAQWDWNSDGNAPADALGEAMMHMANSAAYHGDPLPDAHAKLREVVDKLMKGFGRIDPPLGDVQRMIRGKVDLPANGGTDTLRAATTWDPQPDGRMRVKHGDSFIMLINWDKAGRVTSQSIQPYGAATNRPASPHYTDQMKLFVEHRFKPVHFEGSDLAQHARRAYRVN